METSFTKFPEPVGDTETSWKDLVDVESEASKPWTGDAKLKLPSRPAYHRFPHYPDYNDSDFDATSAEAHLRAREQRYRERFVAIAEMKLLQTELRECYAKNTVNAPRLCRPLAQEYMRRLKCPLYVCDMEKRPVIMYSDKELYGPAVSKVKPFYGGSEQPFEGK